MKRLILLCLLLAGCAQRMELQTEPIALLYSAEEASKTDALTVDDPVSVYAAVDGAGNYFLENSPWRVGPDGKALVPPQPVFYPDAKQAVAFWAYFGSQSIPTDQSTAAALKQADLCWASASSTPSHAPVPLTFRHMFARLVVTCSQPTAKITAINAFSGGTLDIRSGAFANSTKSDIFTAHNELIVPAQTLNRLVVTSNGVEYVFDGSIALEAGKTTTINLTLNTSTQTATLNGSSVSAWAAQTSNGAVSEAVSNVLTLHWPNFIQQGALPDKVVLTVNGSDYTVNSGIGYANQTFTVPFASSALRYPYTISKITFYSGSTQSLPACTQLLGATVYKSAAQTLGIKDQGAVIKIGNLLWATGYLVASNPNAPGIDGPGGCTIGTPGDVGLYFNYFSLIGMGKSNSQGGRQLGTGSFVHWIRPTGCTYGSGWPTQMVTASYPATDNPVTGAGDPCRYYLGAPWRTPTSSDNMALLNWSNVNDWGYKGWNATVQWTDNGPAPYNCPGVWIGPNAASNPSLLNNLFLRASKYVSSASDAGDVATRTDLLTGSWCNWYNAEITWNDPFAGRFIKSTGWNALDIVPNRSFHYPIRCVRPAV